MSAIIAYNISSQQAVTTTFTELQQQLLAQYAFTKRASNRKFKQEIEAKWLITQTLSTLKEKTDELVREFFDNLRTKTACAVAEAAQELQKRQQSEGGRADQSGVESRKKGEWVAKAEDAMEVDGTGPSGMPKAPAPKEKVATPPKRHNVEDHEERKAIREHGKVQSKPRGPQRSPTVDEEEMKVVKEEEFDALIRPRIKTLDEAMRRRMEKGKGKATDLAASGVGKATDEITVHKVVAPKRHATAKSKLMVGLETDEAGKAARPVAGPSKPCQRPEPSSDEGEEFPEPSDNDDESDAKPRKGSMALPKVEIVERNMRGTTHLPSLGPTNVHEGGCPIQMEEVAPVLAEWQAFMQETNRQMDDLARQIGDLGREVNRRLESNSNKLDSMDRGLKLVLDVLGRNGLADTEGSVEQRSEPAYQAVGSTYKRTLLPTASSVPALSQTRAVSEDVNMDLASLPAAAAPIVTVQEPTPRSNTALANLSHALAQLQVPPPRMTRAQSATPTEPLRRSTCLTSQTPAPDDSKVAK
ncbi:hypothetical protein BDN71DRAFT_1434931 [Pleurotus eryngii]|uniref:Uncharacterized protein n=1 Tax=Pleurotus eryngii TaxID=5323 RepID=A0A9P5ZM74_PLEER|nr:hypothetical protein BDN71DRAFT_1434931 [Pleurotus eryngii]